MDKAIETDVLEQAEEDSIKDFLSRAERLLKEESVSEKIREVEGHFNIEVESDKASKPFQFILNSDAL